jgi:hypothetical protein
MYEFLAEKIGEKIASALMAIWYFVLCTFVYGGVFFKL